MTNQHESAKTKPAQLFAAYGLRVKNERLKQKLGQKDLAAAIDMSLSTIARIEQGKDSPEGDTFEKVAAALRVTGEWLATGSGPKEAHVIKRIVREYDERYPNRAEAIRLAREISDSPDAEKAIGEVKKMVLDSETDLSVQAWIEEIVAESKRIRRGIKSRADTELTIVPTETGALRAQVDERMKASSEEIREELKKRR